MNYVELTAAAEAYVENYEASFVSTLPTIIGNVERGIYQMVHLPALRKNVTGVTTANNKYLAMPSDFLAPYALSIVIPATMTVPAYQQFLLNKDPEFMREAFPDPTIPGPPTHYGIFDVDSFILAPTPDLGYTAELHYFYEPESIVTAGNTWLGDNFPNALLYGVLVEAYVYAKGEPDVLKMYQDLFATALGQLKSLGDGQDRRDTYRTEQQRTVVV